MENVKQKNKSQARKLHTNWNTTNHCLTFRSMISTMYRKGGEDVRHTDIQRNYTMLLRGARHWHLLYPALAHDGMKANPVTHLRIHHDGSGLCRTTVWGQIQFIIWHVVICSTLPISEDTPYSLPLQYSRTCLFNKSKFIDDLLHKHYSKSKRVLKISILKVLSPGRNHIK